VKIINQTNTIFLLRFDPDEEVITGVSNFVTENKITAGSFNAIGAAKNWLQN